MSASKNDGCTPCHIASQQGHDNVLILLIAAGVNINCVSNSNYTPLDAARIFNQQKTIDILLANNAVGNLDDDAALLTTIKAT